LGFVRRGIRNWIRQRSRLSCRLGSNMRSFRPLSHNLRRSHCETINATKLSNVTYRQYILNCPASARRLSLYDLPSLLLVPPAIEQHVVYPMLHSSTYMEGSMGHTRSYSSLPLAQAVKIAWNSEDGVDQHLAVYLEIELDEVWGRLQAEPDSYILLPEEFALFNYYISRFGDHHSIRNATKRYWDNHQA
jgi:hypothetical protein